MLTSLTIAGLALAASFTQDSQDSWLIHGATVYTSTGQVIENGIVHVSDGRITHVQPGADVPTGRFALSGMAVTAGMMDASVRITPGFYSVEQSNEIQAFRDIVPNLDLFDTDWDRQARSGVTTVVISPYDRNVVGGLSAVLKTSGEPTFEARVVKRAAALRGAIGGLPSSGNSPTFGAPQDFYRRRPTTRMGVEWEWRKAYFDAAASTRLPEKAFPGREQLLQTLSGELPLFIETWTSQDVRTAVFLKEELEREGFGSPTLILDAAAEAWVEPAYPIRAKAAVVLPPFDPDGRTGYDRAFVAWNVGKTLVDAGLTIALSSHGAARANARLGMQAGYARRGGLTLEQALAAVTINPARMFGVDDRVGSIEAGKDADLVIWNGEPFQPSSRIVGVLADGVLVVDPRSKQ